MWGNATDGCFSTKGSVRFPKVVWHDYLQIIWGLFCRPLLQHKILPHTTSLEASSFNFALFSSLMCSIGHHDDEFNNDIDADTDDGIDSNFSDSKTREGDDDKHDDE